jgi:hypothetical protein
MAGIAVVRKDRTHVGLEEGCLVTVLGKREGSEREEHQRKLGT